MGLHILVPCLKNLLIFRCFEHGQYRQALGIAIETKRIDVFERAVTGDLTDVQVITVQYIPVFMSQWFLIIIIVFFCRFAICSTMPSVL
jgi:hypothetical protein